MYKKISRLVEHVLSLLVVFLMLTAATVWTGRLFGHDIGTSKSANTLANGQTLTAPSTQQLQQLGLDAGSIQLVPHDSASWNILSANNTLGGTIVSTQPYAPQVQGFAGATPLYIYIGTNGTIQQIVAADNAETADFFKRAFEQLAPQWTGKTITQAAALKVDAVSGATFSSNAVIANVELTLASLSTQEQQRATAPTIGWTRTLAVLFVLALGILASLFMRGNKWIRIAVLILNVSVLGFWCGQFLSLSLLRGWISNGLDPIAYLPTLLVLAVAVMMPLFRHKQHYCSWVCPLGSLQTLTAMLPLPKIHCTAKMYRVMRRIRLYAFALLMLLLWTFLGADCILNYEPFTAFFLGVVPPAVSILALIIVVASCFVPNVWCKCLCPMGMALTLSEDSFTFSK